MDFYLQGFIGGSESCLFDCLAYLMYNHKETFAKDFLIKAWNTWYDDIISKEPIQDTKKDFLVQVAAYAFILDADEL